MVLLVIHERTPERNALQVALTRGGYGPCLAAANAEEMRALYATAGPAVSVIITPVENALLVAEWRRELGPVRAVFLANGDLTDWASRLPGELLLPATPLPVDAVVGWVTALASEYQQVPSPGLTPLPVMPSDQEVRSAIPAGEPRRDNPFADTASIQIISPDEPLPSPPVSPEGMPILGDYELLEILREDDHTVTYRALQRSVQRIVILERLRTAQASQPEAVQAFRSLVRAQAAVVHPQIAAVYEAQQQEGWLFYTREWIEGKNLAQLRALRQRLGQEALLDLLSAAAEAVVWLDRHGIPRRPLGPSDIVLGRDGLPRIANLATGTPPDFPDEAGELRAVTQATQALLDPSRPAAEFHLLGSQLNDPAPRGLQSWAEFAPAVAEARRRAAETGPPHTRRLSVSTQQVVARRRWRRRSLLAAAAAAAALSGIALVQWVPYWRAPKPRPLDEMVRIPGGPFIFQAGEMRELPEFWIGAHEVSLAQYAEFLDALARSPTTRYDHPQQPPGKTTHQPADWKSLYAAARKGGTWRGMPVDVNCPVTGVDFWDAWAYARWRGHRLPTEEEWEKAARSTDGRLHPWGREPDAPRANTGADFTDGPGRGRQDGFAGWAPVDAFAKTDRSPYGVVGLAGNVSEWTDSTMLHPEILDQQVPVLRGGSYALRPMEMTHRRPAASPEAADLTTGFRTATDQAP